MDIQFNLIYQAAYPGEIYDCNILQFLNILGYVM